MEIVKNASVKILGLHGNKIYGTGFFISEKIVVTCVHVLTKAGYTQNDSNIKLQSSINNLDDLTAKLNICNKEYDIAFLEVKEKPEEIIPLPIGDSKGLFREEFYSFGYPGGIENGTVGTITDYITINDNPMLQLSSNDIRYGFSGSAVYCLSSKRVIGVATGLQRKDDQDRGIYIDYAIPSDILEKLFPDIAIQDICPFKGLNFFSENDAGLFFGRGKLISRIINKITSEPRLLAIIGPSGSGKTSLIQAGVIPVLRKANISDTSDWNFITVRPTDTGFQFTNALDFATVEGEIFSLSDWRASLKRKNRIVIIIDKFEELFQIKIKDIAMKMCEDILALSKYKLPTSIIIISRDDFWPRFANDFPVLFEIFTENLIWIPDCLEKEDVISIISEPAKNNGLSISDGLVETILDDLISSNGKFQATKLPLLEFTLTRLWELRRDNTLFLESYKNINRIKGSITKWADDTFMVFTNEEKDCAKRIFLDLINIGEVDVNNVLPITGMSKYKDELVNYSDNIKIIQGVLNELINKRLLVSRQISNRECLELIHDSIIINWSKLQKWIEESKEFLLWRKKFRFYLNNSNYLQDQKRGKKNVDYLVGGKLSDAENWLREKQENLNENEINFIYASKKNSIRRKRKGIFAIILVIVGLVSWAGTATYQNRISQQLAVEKEKKAIEAQENEQKANEFAVESQKNAEEAEEMAKRYFVQNSINQTQYMMESYIGVPEMLDFPSILAIELNRIMPNEDTESGLRNILSYYGQRLFSVEKKGGYTYIVSTSPNNEFFAINESNFTRVIDFFTGKEVFQIVSKGCVESIEFSGNGKKLLVSTSDDLIQIWDLETKNLFYSYQNDMSTNQVQFTNNDNWIAIFSENKIRLLEIPTNIEISTVSFDRKILAQRISPDYKKLVVVTDDGMLSIRNIISGKLIYQTSVRNSQYMNNSHIQFTSDSKYLVVKNSSQLLIWNTNKWQSPSIIAQKNGIDSFIINPIHNWVITGDGEGKGLVWNLENEKLIYTIGQNYMISNIKFSPNGQKFSLMDDCYNYTIFNANTGEKIKYIRTKVDNVCSRSSGQFSNDGEKYIVAGYDPDSIIRVWDLDVVYGQTHNKKFENKAAIIKYSLDGSYYLLAGCDTWENYPYCENGSVGVFDSITNQGVVNISYTGHIENLNFIENGKFIFNTCEILDPNIKICRGKTLIYIADIDSGETVLRQQIDSFDDQLYSLNVGSSKSNYITAECNEFNDAEICLSANISTWEINSGKLLSEILISEPVSDIELMSDTDLALIYECNNDYSETQCKFNNINILNIKTGLVMDVVHEVDEKHYLSLSPSGKILLEEYCLVKDDQNHCTKYEGKFSDLQTEKEISRFSMDELCYDVHFIEQEQILFCSGKYEVKIMDIKMGEELFSTEKQLISNVQLSPDNTLFAITTIRGGTIFSIPDKKYITSWDAFNKNNNPVFVNYPLDLSFSLDNSRIITSDEFGNISIWLWKSQDLANAVCENINSNLSIKSWNTAFGNTIPELIEYHKTCPDLPIPPEE